ncbi:MAG TPA: alcohol dehydrogenase [Gammaproteobacteria bacterium]|nr:alcohol dehydrogenase [Gammaproteobacteria bacterium]
MKIRAAVLETTGVARPYTESKPLVIAELDLDKPGPGEVLVKIAAAGLCHSDLSVIDGNRPRPTPMALGHEAAGIVEETGPGVNDLAVGDHVVFVFVPSCGQCLPCAQGRPALCEPGAVANGNGTLLSGAKRLVRSGESINHHLGVSALAEYATVSQQSVVKIDPALDLTKAALFGCAVLTGFGAVVNTGQVKPGTSTAVVGLGVVGLCALMGTKASGARQVIAVDLADDKLELARELGATHTVNAGDEDAIDQVKEISKGGVDYAFEMAGSVHALRLAYNITARGGTTVTAGLPHPDHLLDIPAVTLVAEERTLKGSYIGGCVPRRDLPRFMEMYELGQLPVDRLLSDVISLDDINLGFERLAAGESVRQVVGF